MGRYLFVITTKKFLLPSEYKQVECAELDRYVEESIMVQQPKKIQIYLKLYKQDGMTSMMMNYIHKECNTIPLVRRVVEDFHIYTAPCISKDLIKGKSLLSHDYVAKIVEIAKKDMGFDEQDDTLFVIAHDKDLTRIGGVRCFDQRECLGQLSEIPNGHIFIFKHELGHPVYENLIVFLKEDDAMLLEGCKKTIQYLLDHGA